MPYGIDATVLIEQKYSRIFYILNSSLYLYFLMNIQNHIQNSLYLDSMSCAVKLNIIHCMCKYYIIGVKSPITMISIPQITLVFRK